MLKKIKTVIKLNNQKTRIVSHKKIIPIISILLIIFLLYNIFFRNNELFALS